MRTRTPKAILIALLASTVCACASAPTPSAQGPATATPLARGSGLVIGTLSYQYIETGAARAGPPWVVHLERVDATAPQDYTLVVDVDPATRSGVFTGALPAGVYAFRDAASDYRRFAAGALKMPFEVQAGEVRDAGHYALNPLSAR
jgi:hypothetical protein